MPFGLTNASAVVMNRVCKSYLDQFVIMFIDNIIIYSNSKDEHEVHLGVMLELLKKEELFAKLSKCEIRLQEVHFFGQVVNNSGFHVDPSKIEVVKNWKVPKTPTKIRLFLGLAGSKVKDEQQRPPGLLQQLEIPEWKWNKTTMEVITKFPTSSSGTDYHPQTDGQSEHTIQTLEDMLRAYVIDFGGSWDVYLSLAELIGPELVQETTDKVVLIKENLKAVRDCQKSYASNRIKPLELRIGPVAYKLSLPEELSEVHDTFHVSYLKKCLADANLHMPLKEIKIEKNPSFC
ncbi:putative reverse transcriptase domain-containing protein [Tanacetum coccineum]